MTTDFSQPVITSNYVDFLQYLKDRDSSLAAMDFSLDTNLPTGTLRYDRTVKELQEWSGSAWVSKQIGTLADGSATTAALADNAVNTVKFRAGNDSFLRWRNAANNADLSLLKADATDNTILNAGTSKSISFQQNAAEKWRLDGATAALLPGVTDTYRLGSSGARVLEAFIRDATIVRAQNFGAALELKTITSHSIEFYTNGIRRFSLDASGNLIPETNNVGNLGDSSHSFSTFYVTNILALTALQGRADNALSLCAQGTYPIYFSTAGVNRWSMGGGGELSPIAPDSYNIGNGSCRVLSIYVKNIGYCEGIDSGSASTLGVNATNGISLRISGVERFSLDASNLIPTSNLSMYVGNSSHMLRIIWTEGLWSASALGLNLGTNAAHPLIFSTNGIEQARITNAGVWWYSNQTIYTGRTTIDEYMKIQVNGNVRYIKLFS